MTDTQNVSVPVEVGGRAVTSFNAGGVAVTVEGTQATADAALKTADTELKRLQAELLQSQLGALRRGIVTSRTFAAGPRQ